MAAPTKPGTIYVFDSTGIHLVTPTSGHLASGFANNEVPGSGEINALFQNTTMEVAWLDYEVVRLNQVGNGWYWQQPGISVVTGGTSAGTLIASTSGGGVGGTGPSITRINTRLDGARTGMVLAGCKIICTMANDTGGSSHGSWELSIVHASGSVDVAYTSGTVTGPLASRTTETLAANTGFTAYSIVDGDVLYVETDVGTASAGNVTLYAVGLLLQLPS